MTFTKRDMVRCAVVDIFHYEPQVVALTLRAFKDENFQNVVYYIAGVKDLPSVQIFDIIYYHPKTEKLYLSHEPLLLYRLHTEDTFPKELLEIMSYELEAIYKKEN